MDPLRSYLRRFFSPSIPEAVIFLVLDIRILHWLLFEAKIVCHQLQSAASPTRCTSTLFTTYSDLVTSITSEVPHESAGLILGVLAVSLAIYTTVRAPFTIYRWIKS